MRLGSFEVASRFRMGFTNLHHTKKDINIWGVSDFREINKRIVRKPFPIPKIRTVLQELEGFTYAMALDLNMGYYSIRLNPDASNICTIILPWRNHSYLRLPMGVACSPDIFQAKMSEVMGTLEFVRTYIDDLLCITKGSLNDHLISKLKRVYIRLRDTQLKVNVCKSLFCATETEYLDMYYPEMVSNLEKEGTSDSGINAAKKCQRVT